jgi:hypothetical protein
MYSVAVTIPPRKGLNVHYANPLWDAQDLSLRFHMEVAAVLWLPGAKRRGTRALECLTGGLSCPKLL